MNYKDKKKSSERRRLRIRRRIHGTGDRPRLSVHFSTKHVYAQCIDDDTGLTIAALSTLALPLRDKKIKPNVNGASEFGIEFGKHVLSYGIKQVVFDRSTKKYHGVIASFANAARESGLSF
ncbi:MAG: 50S ribosomal protein L18 [Puniceicoccales bacterium]|jgi:large subunit ribosomal protein L18|nr:50S ribosomal protein L18 [Puniceicoccales bacterium]